MVESRRLYMPELAEDWRMNRCKWRICAILGAAIALGGCSREQAVTHAAILAPPPETAGPRQIRSTGTVQAEKAFTVQVPQISGQAGGGTPGGAGESGGRGG